jgi:hypothetical protein
MQLITSQRNNKINKRMGEGGRREGRKMDVRRTKNNRKKKKEKKRVMKPRRI